MVRWGVERRLEFIEFRLFWEGSINRSDLIDQFRISVPQASKDLSLYQQRAPGNMRYDTRQKTYFAEPKFTLRFLEPDASLYLSQLRSATERNQFMDQVWIGDLPVADLSVTPKRDVGIEVLRTILTAIRSGQSVEILYQSMNQARPEPVWRRIAPHAFGYDGDRWHARAYCELESRFRDFLLPRVLDSGSFGKPAVTAEADWLWNNFFEIELVPHPRLTSTQKAVVAKDYGFSEGKGTLHVRYAMLFYVAKKLGLRGDAEKEDPRHQHIVAANKSALHEALRLSEVGSGDVPATVTDSRVQ
jgi:hypothetical protein